jgi:hypothetical protein
MMLEISIMNSVKRKVISEFGWLRARKDIDLIYCYALSRSSAGS